MGVSSNPMIPPFLLIPGLDGRGISLNRFLSLISPGTNHSLVAHDDLLTAEEVASRILDRLRQDPTIRLLIAESFGSIPALLAARQSSSIASVVVVNGIGDGRAIRAGNLSSIRRTIMRFSGRLTQQWVTRYLLSSSSNAEALSLWSNAMRNGISAGIAAKLRRWQQFSIDSLAKDLVCRVIYIGGESDGLLDLRRQIEPFKKRLKNFRAWIIPEAPHLLLQTHPYRVVELLVREQLMTPVSSLPHDKTSVRESSAP